MQGEDLDPSCKENFLCVEKYARTFFAFIFIAQTGKLRNKLINGLT